MIPNTNSSMIEFEDDTQAEHLQNFRKISQDLLAIEEEYKNCIHEIPDNEYTEDAIEDCVGRDFVKVQLDIKYEIMKIMSKGDQTIREIMIEYCYVEAGEDEILSNGCDLVERDTLEALWKGLPFHKLLAINVEKYELVMGEMDHQVLVNLLEIFENFAIEFFEIMDEIDSHKDVTLLRIKELIDDRTKSIVNEAKMHPELV